MILSRIVELMQRLIGEPYLIIVFLSLMYLQIEIRGTDKQMSSLHLPLVLWICSSALIFLLRGLLRIEQK